MKKINIILLVLLFCGFSLNAQDNGKLSSLAFFNYTYKTNDNVVVNNGFEFDRVYLTYQNVLADNLKYKLTTDVSRNDSKGNLNVFLKNAQVDWTTKYGTFIFGLQNLNVFGVQENTWGHRYIEKSAMDKQNFASSADLGVGYANTLLDDLFFSVIVSNGSGYMHPEFDKHKKLSANLVYGQTDLYNNNGFNFGGVASYEPYEAVETENTTLLGVFGGYSQNAFRAGAEYNILTMSGADVSANLISAYLTYNVLQDIDLFGRVDSFDPNTDVDEDGLYYFIGGFSWTPVSGLKIAPNVKYTDFQNKNSEAITDVLVNFEFRVN